MSPADRTRRILVIVKHFLLYSSLRLLLLVVVGGLFYALGARGMTLILLAFLVSGIMSFFVLRGPRTELGSDMNGFFARINARIDAASAAEDAPASDPGVRVKPAEQQVDPEVVEPEHHNS